jgi:hypothetical protein
MRFQAEAVFSQPIILHLILDVLTGTGMLKPVLPAQNSGFFNKENALEFLLIATLTPMPLENALAASKDSSSMQESVRLDQLKVLSVNLLMMLDLA